MACVHASLVNNYWNKFRKLCHITVIFRQGKIMNFIFAFNVLNFIWKLVLTVSTLLVKAMFLLKME